VRAWQGTLAAVRVSGLALKLRFCCPIVEGPLGCIFRISPSINAEAHPRSRTVASRQTRRIGILMKKDTACDRNKQQ